MREKHDYYYYPEVQEVQHVTRFVAWPQWHCSAQTAINETTLNRRPAVPDACPLHSGWNVNNTSTWGGTRILFGRCKYYQSQLVISTHSDQLPGHNEISTVAINVLMQLGGACTRSIQTFQLLSHVLLTYENKFASLVQRKSPAYIKKHFLDLAEWTRVLGMCLDSIQ